MGVITYTVVKSLRKGDYGIGQAVYRIAHRSDQNPLMHKDIRVLEPSVRHTADELVKPVGAQPRSNLGLG